MTGHSKWSEVRREVTPERRARIDAIKAEMARAEAGDACKVCGGDHEARKRPPASVCASCGHPHLFGPCVR